MFSRFFIDRPVFANVIAVVTVLFGIVALYRLPVERYPAITPPTALPADLQPRVSRVRVWRDALGDSCTLDLPAA